MLLAGVERAHRDDAKPFGCQCISIFLKCSLASTAVVMRVQAAYCSLTKSATRLGSVCLVGRVATWLVSLRYVDSILRCAFDRQPAALGGSLQLLLGSPIPAKQIRGFGDSDIYGAIVLDRTSMRQRQHGETPLNQDRPLLAQTPWRCHLSAQDTTPLAPSEPPQPHPLPPSRTTPRHLS